MLHSINAENLIDDYFKRPRGAAVSSLLKHRSPKIDVLVAEDNAVNCLYVEYILKEIGLTCKIVNDGQMVIEYFKSLAPRLILMDVSIRILNGYQATHRIRSIETKLSLASTRIIATSNQAPTKDQRPDLSDEIDGYLTKPLSINSIKRVMHEWNFIENQPDNNSITTV